MKGTLKYEQTWKERLDMQYLKMGTSLERKINLINEDFENLISDHYEFKANHKNIENLLNIINKARLDLTKYEDILKRYIKYNEVQNG